MDLSMLPDFIVEAMEHLEEMETSLLQLEQDRENEDNLNEIFRSIHSIKGAAQYIGLEKVSELSHKLESLLDLVRKGEIELSQEGVDLFIDSRDRINVLVDQLEQSQSEDAAIDDLLQRIKNILNGTPQGEANGGTVPTGDGSEEAPLQEPAQLVNETLGEDHDERLITIFIKKLGDNVDLLHEEIKGLSTSSDQKKPLSRCRDILSSLHSSTHYMGYQMLCEFYEAWIARIDKAVNNIASGGDAKLGFMQVYLDELVRAYPQAEDGGELQQEELVSEEAASDSIEHERVDESLESTSEPGYEGETFATADEPEDVAKRLKAVLSDDTTDPATSVAEVAKLVNESLEEEFEEELFDIFIVNLKENVGFLQIQITDLKDSLDPKATLRRCVDTIKSLNSSAKYMGYSLLCDHYLAWQDSIDAALQGLSSGIEVDLGFMQTYLDEITSVYPDTLAGVDDQTDQTTGEAEAGGPADEPEQEHLDETLDSLFGDSMGEEDEPYDTEKGAGVSFEEPEGELSTETDFSSEAASDQVYTTEQEKLEQTLSSSLNQAMDHSTSEEQDTEVRSEEEKETSARSVAMLSNAFDETTSVTTSTKEIKKLVSESIEEEYDQELLEIFLQQLKESVILLQTQIDDFEVAADKEEVLDQCSGALKNLRSSANYMGYDLLCSHYDACQEEIDDAIDELYIGGIDDIDFMQKYLDEIIRVYPQAKTTPVPEEEAVDKTYEESVVRSVEEDFGYVDAAGKEGTSTTVGELLSDSPPPVDISEQPEEGEQEPVLHEESRATEEEVTDVDQLLFGKLQNALESSLEGKEHVEVPDNQMHGVIEEMISPSSAGVKEPKEKSIDDEKIAEKPEPSAPEVSRGVENEAQAGGVEDESLQEPQDELPEMLQAGAQGDKEDVVQEKVQVEKKLQPKAEQGEEEQPAAQQSGQEEGAAVKQVKQSMRVDADKIDYLMNQVGELVVSRAYFSQLSNEIKTLQQDMLEQAGLSKSQLKPLNEFSFKLGEAGVALGRVSNELQEAVMKVRMLPIAQLFKRYPRLVRDLVKKSDKKVNLVVRGESTELDKMVIEEISDPLIHIIRNAVDHGIESVSERKRLGKPEVGTLALEAYHESNHIVIEIADDGKGIDPVIIKEKALKKGLYSEEELERMTPLEATRIVMLPGFSTAEKATETSGRGVGMDVVKRNIEKLNGTIDIESTAGQQTLLRIKIPLTLAIIQALMVRVDMETFTIPLTTVEETLRIYQNEISEIEGVEVIHLRDATMPIFRLSKIFDMRKKTKARAEDKFFVVVVSTGMQAVGLVVDELLGQEEVVIKPLADYLRMGSGFSGATIIGDGAISLILDVPELVKMTTEQQVLKQQQLTLNRRRKDGRTLNQQTEALQ